MDTFEPSGDYGGVYPYVAAQVVRISEKGESQSGWRRYGLVDRDGRILTDGIYSNVQVMRMYDDTEDRYFCQPFWITEICDNPEIRQTLNYYDELIDVLGVDDRFGVISMDGSFALPEDYVYISSFTDGFCCYRSYLYEQGFKTYDINEYSFNHSFSSDFEVYDGQGKLCFTGKQVKGTEGKKCSLRYGDGLYLLDICDRNDEESGSNPKRECWFLDKTGKRIAGPYVSADTFSDGLACVSSDGENYGFIDKTGTLVIPEQFTSATGFRDGYAVVCSRDGRVVMIDRTGKQLLQFATTGWGHFVPCGVMAGQYPDYYYFDLEGNLLAHEGQNDYIQCLDEDTFFSTWYESSKLFRTNGEELSVDRLNDVIPFWTVCNGVPTSGYCGWKSSKGGYMTVFIPHDLSAACPLEIPSYVTNFIRDPHSYEDPSYEVYDGTSGDHWYLTPDKDGWNAVRNDGTVYRIPLRAQKIYLCGDRIIGVSDHASAMLDLEENVIFFYPLDAED